MRIYRIAQNQPNQQNQPIDQRVVQEIMESFQKITYSIANINESLKIIEQTGADQLFKKENIIEAIQSGDFTTLDINKIDQALEAMSHISQSVPIINTALRYIQDNAQIATTMNLDAKIISDNMVTSLQTGDYSQFQSSLSVFQNSMQGMSGTTGNIVGN